MTSPLPDSRLTALIASRYTIEREIGRGGMGTVYLARDLRLDRPVAIKVLPEEFVRQPALRERFLRETRTAASFSHPNIVPVYAVEESDDVLAFVMAFIEGESVAERVRRSGPLSVRDSVRVLQDVGYALAYAHGRGVVHRDIKPDNIMLERATGRALVMDFGVARAMSVADARHGLTRAGEILGTPDYMSPEQASGDDIDGRSDIYSLGLTAFYCVTGQPAVSGDTPQKALVKQITEKVPPVASVRADVPPSLAQIIDRCAVKEPGGRYATAEALVEAVEQAQLVAPEIPYLIRNLAVALEALNSAAVVAVACAALLVAPMTETRRLDVQIVLALVVSQVALRALAIWGMASGLAWAGFAPADVLRGLRDVWNSLGARRAEIDAVMKAARSRLFAMMALVVGCLAGAFLAVVGLFGADTFYLMYGLITFGCAGVLLVRSVTHISVGMLLFRVFWLGAPVLRLMRAAHWLVALKSRRGPFAANASSIHDAWAQVGSTPVQRTATADGAKSVPDARQAAMSKDDVNTPPDRA